jgi:diguanylate cyclase (GGDEF)-like protein
VALGPRGDVSDDLFLLQLALYFVIALGTQLMTFEDMTQELRTANGRLETAQSELRQMVVTDALTGCRNRRFFDEVITHELNNHRRYATPLSLLFVDVDHFKTINDTLGHSTGDRVLKEVAAFLMRKTRDADYVFRWGGDEFLLLLECREEEAVRRGRELQDEFAAPDVIGGLPPGVGLSVGSAEIAENADHVHDALKLADERMYANKRRSRIAGVRAV